LKDAPLNDQTEPALSSSTEVPSGYQKLDRHHLTLERLIGGFIVAIATLIAAISLAGYALIAGSVGIGFGIAVTASLLIILPLIWFGWIYPGLAYRHASWRLNRDGLEIRRGVWWQHRIIVPRSRVQHSDIHQGPMQRNYGLADLIVHTAGTSNSSVKLEGLAAAKAESLRETLLSECLEEARPEAVNESTTGGGVDGGS
jgi:membrane protein YdbS with pleckstrin-like domain